jgi:hypothetical protein
VADDDRPWTPICSLPTGLVHPVAVDPTGRHGPKRAEARGRAWRRSSHGLYVPSGVDGSAPEQRIVEQAARLTGGAVTGWASCRMHGAAYFDGRRDGGRVVVPVPLNCGTLHRITKRPGDDLIRDFVNDTEVTWIAGVPCTVPIRATFDAMRYARSVREAVVAFDMMAAAKLVSLRRMRDYVYPHKQAWQGVQRVRDALALADENSWSPQESRLRLVWVLDAKRPRPLTNRPLFTLDGRLLGYPDLLDPDAGLVGEYDGEDHRRAARHSHDVDREAAFRDHGLEVFRVTGPDMHNPSRVIDRIVSAYGRARHLPPARRAWTLQHPSWWPLEPPLDQLLDTRDDLRRTGRQPA